jgi:uncharacterized protein (DUF433 family)
MTLPTVSVPISEDEYGAIRVANTRVTLDVIVAAYQNSDSPEQIQEGFPSLKLADIYAVITYYLNHQDAVDAYLHQRDEQAKQTHAEIESKRPDMFRLQKQLPERLT